MCYPGHSEVEVRQQRKRYLSMPDPYCPQCKETTDLFFFHSLTEAVCTYCGGPVRTCSRCGALHSEKWHQVGGKRVCHSCLDSDEQRPASWNEAGDLVCCWCHRAEPLDSDMRCRECAGQEIHSVLEAADLVAEVMRFLDRELGLRVKRNYRVELGSVEQLGVEQAASRPIEAGSLFPASDLYYHGATALGCWVRRSNRVIMRPGLPSWLFAAVVAHQHAHAWQADTCQDQSPILIESFARWVELKLVNELGDPELARALHQEETPIFSQGLAKILRMEERLGERGVVNQMQGMRDFPIWSYTDSV